MKKSLSALISILISAIMLFSVASCGKEEPVKTKTDAPETTVSQESTANEEADNGEVTTLGEGAVSFNFTVTDPDGKDASFIVNTDETTVGQALIKLGLIAGEEGPYGLYVKTVNGTTLDYDKDGKYWAFYIDGELAPTGVDMTDITEGTSYAFKAE